MAISPCSYTLSETLGFHTGSISAVRFSSDGTLLGSSSADNTIMTYSGFNNTDQVVRSATVQVFRGHKQGVSDFAFSTDSRRMVSASDDTNVGLWDVNTGRLLSNLKGHLHAVFTVCFHPDCNIVASGSADGVIFLWDARIGTSFKIMPGHLDVVSAIAFSRCGDRMISGGRDGLCKMWESYGRYTEKLETIKEPVSSVMYTPTNNILVGTLDSTLTLWNPQRCPAELVNSYSGHINRELSIMCSTTGREECIVSGSEDSNIYVWNSHSGKIIQKLEGHRGKVLSVSCHPTKSIIASGAIAEDKTVRIWAQ